MRAAPGERRIEPGPVFSTFSTYPIYRRRQLPSPVGERTGRQAINLTSGVCLTRAQVAQVGGAMRDAVARRAA